MQVTEEKNEGLQREFVVTLEANEIDEKVESRLREIGQNQKIPGFRPGKAPMSILKQRFGQAVMGEVLERAVSDSSQQVVQERGLRPAGQPDISLESFEQGQDLVYRMKVELLPDIEPMDFSQISVTTQKVEVPDHEVDEALERLASQQKESKAVEEPRPAGKGDILVVDFSGEVDGEKHPGMEAEDHHLELGSNRFVEGFEDQLIGVQPGEEKTVEVTFPDEYMNSQLSGKTAQFQVKVKELREAEPVEINDEFAQKFGEEDLSTLKERVRDQIRQDYERLTRQRTKRQLLDQLADGHSFDVPPSMVDGEFDAIWQQIEQDRQSGQLDAEDAEKSDEQLKEEYRSIAERRVRLGLLLSEVGRNEQIDVTQEELNKALIEEVQRYPGREREVFEHYQNNQDALQSLRAPIYEDKVIDYILELANTEERAVTTDQLREELEAEQAGDSAEGGEDKSAESKSGTKSKSGGSKSKSTSSKSAGSKSGSSKKAEGSKSGSSSTSSSKSGGAKSSSSKSSSSKSGGSKSASSKSSGSKSGSSKSGSSEAEQNS
ncbi:trigger factor [Rhodovibrio salinarum]|uniref:Trigger factor n=1 Tax=Rhodovibrio salinarum TaxID=1087 RepID=A0A934QIH8_9PROT|nr:trigger factor [Rhodovibrio salinarum]MBK1697658.1 trigger factor [Rhodovibrio salinarum]